MKLLPLCADTDTLMCDFEDEECPLKDSVGVEDQWRRVQAVGKVPGADNTLNTGGSTSILL